MSNGNERIVGEHAVVAGASMAGLLTARVLADAFETVTVIERDPLPTGVGQRRGVPQGSHIHALLARGSDALEEVFPGLWSEMADSGARRGDVQADGRWYLGGVRYRQAASGLPVLAVSRPMLESHVRERVRRVSGVEWYEHCGVTGLVGTGGTVTGVRIAPRDGNGNGNGNGNERTLYADLVVDASGRGSSLPAWLDDLGCGTPDLDEVRVGLAYTTRHYRLHPDALGGDLAIIIAATPDDPRGGVVMLQEGGTAVVTLISYLGNHPPTDPDGFEAFAEGLRVPDIHDVIEGAEALDDPTRFRFHASRRFHYERMRLFPQGLIVLGDALCSFNPMYGQGMSVAALEALVLRGCLRSGTARLAPRFFRRALRTVDAAWTAVASTDQQIPGVDGSTVRTPPGLDAYLARVHRAAGEDPAVGRAFLRVSNLVDPPQRLLRPTTVARVWRANRRQARRGPPSHAPARSEGARIG